MRSFPIQFLIIFLIFYLVITVGAFTHLLKLANKKNRIWIKWLFGLFDAFLIVGFVFLYIYPNQPRDATNYPVYFYFNAVLFIDFIFKIPLCVSLLLHYITLRKKSKTILFAGFILSAGTALLLTYGIVFGETNLLIKRYELKFDDLPRDFNGYKIVQISDIHIGSFTHSSNLLQQAIQDVNQFHPDLLLFTGDLVNNFAWETEGWESTFQQLTSAYPSYSILGNHDYGNYTRWKTPELKQENFQGIVDAEKEFGFQLLRNEKEVIKSGSDSIFLAGVENWGHPPFPQYADLEKALANIPNGAFTLLMTHDPAHWESKVKNNKRVNMALSGHTHGLQWGIKLAGIPFSLAYLIRKNWAGLYKSDNSTLIVNQGFGTIGIPWRIDMSPELTLITLKRSEVN